MYEGVLILSPPRSGSSCLTACLSFQGIHLGASPTTVKDAFNAKGYFENQAVLSFNEKVLQSISADIFQTAPLNARQCREATQFAGELAGLMTSQFEARPFLIKDPRIALLQELYRQVLPPVRIISLRRDRQATARSIHHMTHALSRPTVTPEKGERICDLYFQLIDDMAREVPSIRVHFEDLLADSDRVLAGLCEFLELPFTDEGRRESREFIDQTLVRFA